MRVLVAAGTFVLGLVVGLSSAAVHHYWWGLLLAIAATAACARALPPGWSTRVTFTVGWAAMTARLALPLDAGDYVIAGDAQGYTLLAAAVALPVAALVTLPNPRGDPAGRPPPS